MTSVQLRPLHLQGCDSVVGKVQWSPENVCCNSGGYFHWDPTVELYSDSSASSSGCDISQLRDDGGGGGDDDEVSGGDDDEVSGGDDDDEVSDDDENDDDVSGGENDNPNPIRLNHTIMLARKERSFLEEENEEEDEDINMLLAVLFKVIINYYLY